MTTNKYFNNGKNIGVTTEQNLVEDNIIEMIQMQGMDVYYMPRDTVHVDEILQEAPLSAFESFKVIEMYLNSFENLGGNNKFLSKFGLELKDTFEFIVSRRRFKQAVQDHPKTGDLLYLPMPKLIIQIDEVVEETPSYQLGKLYVYTLKCSMFEYSYETFATGITQVDTDLASVTDSSTIAIDDTFDKTTEIVTEVSDNDFINFDETNPFGEIIE